MPLPLIIAGAAIGGCIGGGIGSMLDAKDKNKNTKERYDRRRTDYGFAERRYKGWRENAEAKFEALERRRLGALVTIGRAVDFLKRAKIHERDLEQRFEITPQKLAAWEGVSAHAVEVLGDIAKSGAAGVATATGVYGTVGVLGTASTGTAIGTLSGAAAKSATLAWLGGGSLVAGGGGVALGTVVFGGLVAGPALLVAGFFANSKAEKVKTEVEKQIAEMDKAEAQMEQQIAVIETVLLRVDELYESTDDRALDRLLNQGNPADFEDAYQVARTAKTLVERAISGISIPDIDAVDDSTPTMPTAADVAMKRSTPAPPADSGISIPDIDAVNDSTPTMPTAIDVAMKRSTPAPPADARSAKVDELQERLDLWKSRLASGRWVPALCQSYIDTTTNRLARAQSRLARA